MPSFGEKVKEAIPAEFRMIGGCADCQTSADVSNIASFQLPEPHGRSGGACTSALLKVLYADHRAPVNDLSFEDVLMKMRDILRRSRYKQVPQLSASRPMSIKTKFTLVPNDFRGTRRAVIIGINYVGQRKKAMSGCHNDAMNMKEYIMNVHGFLERDITLLLDDGKHIPPTYKNIIDAYKDIVSKSKAGDSVFCHYSGHGGKLKDDNGDEDDGYDETLIPLDCDTAGQIRDDEIFKTLVLPMAKGVFATAVMDCCHSGTILDLPYIFTADGHQTEMTQNPNFNVGSILKLMKLIKSRDYKNIAKFAVSSEGKALFSAAKSRLWK